MKFLRRKKVEEITGLSRSSIYAMMANGEFPKQTKIGLRAVAWKEADVVEWMNSREN